MLSDLIHQILGLIAEFFKKTEVFWLLFFVVMSGGIALVSVPSIDAVEVLKGIGRFFAATWWFWFFVIFLPILASLWLFWKQAEFKKDTKFILLEIKIPREIEKSPRAMEQVFASIHTLRNAAGDIMEKYWDGEVTRWFSCEMVSFGGEIHLYIRLYHKYRNLVEAAFFAYYPDIEIVEVEDYVDTRFPKDLQEVFEQGKDIWGTEMMLVKEEAYPIKTYTHFEDPEENRQFDPVSTFLEVLGKIKPEEIVAIQLLIAPADKSWADKWEELLEEMRKPSTIEVPTGADDETVRTMPVARSPRQSDILEEVETNLSKPAFDTLIRFVYLSPKSIFYDSFARRGIVGAFNQYSSLDMNSFRQNYTISTRTRIWNKPYVFPKKRAPYRQQRLLYNYRRREIPPETWMGKFITSYLFNWNFASARFTINVEGLASIFHPPTAVVLTAPHIKRVESRKAGPPAGLPIFGEEGEIEKYLK